MLEVLIQEIATSDTTMLVIITLVIETLEIKMQAIETLEIIIQDLEMLEIITTVT